MTSCTTDPGSDSCVCPLSDKVFDPLTQSNRCCAAVASDGSYIENSTLCMTWRATGLDKPYTDGPSKLSATQIQALVDTKALLAVIPNASATPSTGQVSYSCPSGKTPRVLDYQSSNGETKYSSSISCIPVSGNPAALDVSTLQASVPSSIPFAIYRIKDCPSNLTTTCIVKSSIGTRASIDTRDFATSTYSNGSGSTSGGGGSDTKKHILGIPVVAFIIIAVVMLILITLVIIGFTRRVKLNTELNE
jgi:hypothetical protein